MNCAFAQKAVSRKTYGFFDTSLENIGRLAKPLQFWYHAFAAFRAN